MVWRKIDPNLSRKSQMPWFSPIPRRALTQPGERAGCQLSWFHQPNTRFGSSSGPQIVVESEYLISYLVKMTFWDHKGGEEEPLPWEQGQQKTLKRLRKSSLMCLTLGHSDLSTLLCMHEHAGIRGVDFLPQMLVSWHCQVAYLSSNSIAQGWPPWLLGTQCHCHLSVIDWQVDYGKRINSLNATPSTDINGVQGTILAN